MRERYVGRSGLRVSALGLGTRTWGTTTDAETAGEQLSRFVEGGGTLVDTSAAVVGGAAEEVVGRLTSGAGGVVEREDIVLVGGGQHQDTSARSLLAALDASLRRLGTDHVDLWLAHGWDAAVPPEETVGALDLAVRSGRTRYVGLAGCAGWQLATTAGAAAALRRPLVAVAAELSLVARATEVDVLPPAAHHGLGLLARAPLGRGVLAAHTPRSLEVAAHRQVAAAVVAAASGLGVAPADVALAWVLGSTGVAAAVVGARTAEQVEMCLAGAELELPPEISTALDDVSSAVRGRSGD